MPPLVPSTRSAWRDSMRFGLYLFYCIEGGLFLVLVPWSPLWDQLFYFRRLGWLGSAGRHGLARGLVSGVGVALLLHGAWELASAAVRILRARRDPEGP